MQQELIHLAAFPVTGKLDDIEAEVRGCRFFLKIDECDGPLCQMAFIDLAE